MRQVRSTDGEDGPDPRVAAAVTTERGPKVPKHTGEELSGACAELGVLGHVPGDRRIRFGNGTKDPASVQLSLGFGSDR